MGAAFSGSTSKKKFLCDVVNNTIYSLVINSTKADGVRNYFFLSVLGYAGTNVRVLLGDPASGVLPIEQVAAQPIRVESRKRKLGDDGVREVLFPIWVDPQSSGKTPTCLGLRAAKDIISNWVRGHQRSFPPLVLHVTDGHPTDGDPEPLAAELKAVSTMDGEALLFNLHIDGGEGKEAVFPSSERILPNFYAKRLFRMSSLLPETFLRASSVRGIQVDNGSPGLVYNGSIASVVDFFEIGTRAINNLQR